MKTPEQTARLEMLSWNIQAGGFADYDKNLPVPVREEQIQSFVSEQHTNQGVEAVTLTDAYRWDGQYGGNSGIAAHLGFREARFTPLNDERLERDGKAGIGIAFATDRRIAATTDVDLETRQGLKVILDIGRYGLQIANVYLDDLSESLRLRQTRALLAALEPDLPTILTGDFNALRVDMRGASAEVKALDMIVKGLSRLPAPVLARVFPHVPDLGLTIREMNKRHVLPLLKARGYRDADSAHKRPTSPASLPMFGIDYAFHNSQVAIDNFQVLATNGASDHNSIRFRSTVAA